MPRITEPTRIFETANSMWLPLPPLPLIDTLGNCRGAIHMTMHVGILHCKTSILYVIFSSTLVCALATIDQFTVSILFAAK